MIEAAIAAVGVLCCLVLWDVARRAFNAKITLASLADSRAQQRIDELDRQLEELTEKVRRELNRQNMGRR